MLIRNEGLYRKEALEFQRHRMAGVVMLSQARGVWALSVLFLLTSAGAATMAWRLPVEFDRTVPCERVAASQVVAVDLRGLPSGPFDEVRQVRAEVAGQRAARAAAPDGSLRGRVLVPVAWADLQARAGPCSATARVRTRPFALAIDRMNPMSRLDGALR